VKLEASGLSGISVSEKIIVVHELPQADFSYSEPGVAYTEHRFYNNSINAIEYIWDFGDGSTSTEENPTHTYLTPGNYTLTLYVSSAEGCRDTLVRESLIEVAVGEGAAKFPNVFIWNGTGPTGGAWTPGSEDRTVFHPKVNGATELRMIIFNRLGHKLFETNEVFVGWDGYLPTGDLADPGVYIYKAWITYPGGLKEVQAGDLTFLYPE
jgi:PKD repeat protein